MKTAMGLALVVGLVSGPAVRAADSWEKVLNDRIAFLKETTEILKTVKDKKTAKAARPKLKKMGKKYAELARRSQKLTKPSQEEGRALQKKYQKKITAATAALKKETGRVKEVPGGKEALAELKAKGD
jgi:hypothetical protein